MADPGRDNGQVRLFVAVWPPDQALAGLEAAVAPIASRHPELKWQPRERWHITVTFIGDVGDEREPAARAAVERAVAAVPVGGPVRLAAAGTFGRLLWVGLEPLPSPLQPLARACGRELRDARFALERRRWSPHLTLARARGEATGLLECRRALAGYAGPTWDVAELTLVASKPGPDPVYEVLARYPVTRPEASEQA